MSPRCSHQSSRNPNREAIKHRFEPPLQPAPRSAATGGRSGTASHYWRRVSVASVRCPVPPARCEHRRMRRGAGWATPKISRNMPFDELWANGWFALRVGSRAGSPAAPRMTAGWRRWQITLFRDRRRLLHPWRGPCAAALSDLKAHCFAVFHVFKHDLQWRSFCEKCGVGFTV
jgi:hypothetical protein